MEEEKGRKGMQKAKRWGGGCGEKGDGEEGKESIGKRRRVGVWGEGGVGWEGVGDFGSRVGVGGGCVCTL